MNARFLKTVLTAALLTFPFAATAQDPKDMPHDGGITPTGQEKPTTDMSKEHAGMEKTGMSGMKYEKLGNIEVVKGVDQLSYAAAPNFLPRGAEFALIDGDIAKGPFTGYLRLPSGYRLPASRNAGDLQLVVVKGSVRISQEKATVGMKDFSDEGGMVRTGSETAPSGAKAGGQGTTPGTTSGGGMGTSGGGMGTSGAKPDEMGRSAGMAGEMVVNEGGFISIPRNEVFTLMADQNTVLHVHGMGAWSPTYLNASDDPRSGKMPSNQPAAR